MTESIWQTKPWWCQPWSIVLTGVAISATSWLWLHRLWITLPVIGVIALWWLLFLVLVPAQYTAAVKESIAGNTLERRTGQ
ncbi:MAG: DUF6737 family protein [Phormidesmis sp.]